MTDQLMNSKDQPSTNVEEGPVLEIEIPENSIRIDVPYASSDNDQTVVQQLAKPSQNGNTTLPEQNLI